MQSLEIGIDIGTTYVKTSNERCFASGISDIVYPNNDILEINGRKYTVGLKNISDININKSLNQNSRVNFLYALYLESTYSENYFEEVTVGLPCSQWKNEKTVEHFKNTLLPENTIDIKLNNKSKRITVNSISVVPEGSCAYYANDMNNFRFHKEKVLICDWGGRTLNTLLFENDDLIDTHTEELGVLSIYPKMAEKISTETGISINNNQVFNIIKNGLYHKGKQIDIESYISKIALEYCAEIYKIFQLQWNIDTIKFVPMIGGGSIIMTKYLQNYIPQAELQPNAQLLTAIGMGEGVT